MSRTEGKPKPGMNFGAAPPTPVEGNPAAEALAALGGARGMTQTKTAYQTAVTVQVPRDLEAIRAAVIKEASYSRDGFFYAWSQNDKSKGPGGKSLIEGVSIDGAMILVRNWGNACCEPELVDESPVHWMLRATFIDLETGFTSGRLFRQRKNQNVGRHDDERALDIQVQIGQSKAIRNSVVRCLPQWLVDEAMDAAKAAAAKRYENVAFHAGEAIAAYLATHKITVEQLERKLGKKRPDWIPSDIVLLRAIFKALKEGLTSAGQEFSEDEPAPEETNDGVPSGTDLGDQPLAPDPNMKVDDEEKPAAVATGNPDADAAIAKALAGIEADKARAAAAAAEPEPKPDPAPPPPPKPAEPPQPDFAPPTSAKKKP